MNELCTILAYIDPGTGSLLFQMFAAGVLSIVMVFRNSREWILGKIAALTGRSRNQPKQTFSDPAAVEPSSEVSKHT
jgi:hypothetical protein